MADMALTASRLLLFLCLLQHGDGSHTHYYATVKTGDSFMSGTLGKVYMKLFGPNGSTESHRLLSIFTIGFPIGSTTTFDLYDIAVGDVVTKVGVCVQQQFDSWYLKEVTVRIDGKPFNKTFPYNGWLTDTSWKYLTPSAEED